MKFKVLHLSAFAVFFVTLAGMTVLRPGPSYEGKWDENTSVAMVLQTLGYQNPAVDKPEFVSEDMITQGMELMTLGQTTGPDGKKTGRQSKFFTCTNCHNIQREDPDLTKSDPDARLEYAKENGLPLLQGTTMWATVNRESWYNGDYFKKYGDLVKPANKSLKEAIHLCATVCSQGRDFTDWEYKALMSYLWSISLKLGDLNLSDNDWKKLRELEKAGKPDAKAVEWLKGFYLTFSPATFDHVVDDKSKGYGMNGDPKEGHIVYEKSCGHCHYENGPSKYLTLTEDPVTLSFLRRNITKDSRFSIYEIIRKGTYSFTGHKAYMPHYTLERMSNQQVEDLRAYIEQGE